MTTVSQSCRRRDGPPTVVWCRRKQDCRALQSRPGVGHRYIGSVAATTTSSRTSSRARHGFTPQPDRRERLSAPVGNTGGGLQPTLDRSNPAIGATRAPRHRQSRTLRLAARSTADNNTDTGLVTRRGT